MRSGKKGSSMETSNVIFMLADAPFIKGKYGTEFVSCMNLVYSTGNDGRIPYQGRVISKVVDEDVVLADAEVGGGQLEFFPSSRTKSLVVPIGQTKEYDVEASVDEVMDGGGEEHDFIIGVGCYQKHRGSGPEPEQLEPVPMVQDQVGYQAEPD